jgi:hypothetical protein
MKEMVVQDLTELIKMLKKWGIWCIQLDVLSVRAMSVQLNLDKESVNVCRKRPELLHSSRGNLLSSFWP